MRMRIAQLLCWLLGMSLATGAHAELRLFDAHNHYNMDVWTLLPRYRGRLSFHGGLSTQQTLPYGTVEEVRAETRHLIELGRDGGYILSPAHGVEGDVPLENMLAFIEEAQGQLKG